MNRVIAALHAVDFRAAGLDNSGKAGNYFARQIDRWSGQADASTVPISRAMRRLMEWLQRHIPADGDDTTLGPWDYQLDNMTLHPTEPRIVAVLDRELSTLGHPLLSCSPSVSPPGSLKLHQLSVRLNA